MMGLSIEGAARSALYSRTHGVQGSIRAGTVRRVGAFGKPYRKLIATFVVLSVGAALMAVLSPVLAGAVIDAVVAVQGTGPIVTLALLMALVAVAEAALSYTVRWISAALGERVIYDLRTAVFEHVQKMSVAFFSRARTGALVSRLNNDVVGAQQVFSSTLSGIVTNVVTLVLTLIIMVGTSWQVSVLTLMLLPIFLVPARRIGDRVAQLRSEAADLNANLSTLMTERFTAPGAVLLKLFGKPAKEAENFAHHAALVRDVGVKTTMVQASFLTALTLVSTLALALVYGVGGALAVDGQLAPGEIVTLGMLLTRLYAPLTALANARVDMMSALVSFSRVFEVLDLQPLVAEKSATVALPSGPLGVEFDDVRFAYPSAAEVSLASLEDVAVLDQRPSQEVIHGISFRAETSQTVALVGSSGAGKSTIASLVPRLYDVTGGVVRVGGVDVRELSFESLRQCIAMVTQDAHLFHDTIRANINLANPTATEEQLWEAIRRAQLAEVVASLPDGLDTVVGERGYRLSGGERQRLTIARVLLRQPGVVILDEATASLDTASEVAIQAALQEVLRGRTVMVIAHRLSTVRAADVIVVLERGRIVETGSHEVLMQAQGRYAQLYQAQFAAQG